MQQRVRSTARTMDARGHRRGVAGRGWLRAADLRAVARRAWPRAARGSRRPPPMAMPAPAQIVDAMVRHPEFVAGSNRLDTDLMRVAKGRLFAKVGAEGFYCAGVPAMQLGIALKVEDGAKRAAEPALLAVLRRVGRPHRLGPRPPRRLRPPQHPQHPPGTRRQHPRQPRAVSDHQISSSIRSPDRTPPLIIYKSPRMLL